MEVRGSTGFSHTKTRTSLQFADVCQEVAGLGLNGVSINPYFIPGRENAPLVALLGHAAAQYTCD